MRFPVRPRGRLRVPFREIFTGPRVRAGPGVGVPGSGCGRASSPRKGIPRRASSAGVGPLPAKGKGVHGPAPGLTAVRQNRKPCPGHARASLACRCVAAMAPAAVREP